MKIGSVAWGWTPIPEDMPNGDMLLGIADEVKELDFDIIDFLSTYESLDEYYSSAECARVGKYCKELGLEVGGFVFQSSIWNDPNPLVRAKQSDYMKKCAEAAAGIGASTVSCIIPQPFGAKPNRKKSPSEKIASNLPADYNFKVDWDRFISGIAEACDIAAKYNLNVAMECFTRSLCSTPDAMLNLLHDVNRPNIGIQLDTAHLMSQNLDIETAVFMLGGKNIFNVHIKDADGLTRNNLPAGTGLVDYTAFFTALKNVGYKGNASIEVEMTDNPRRYMRQAYQHVKECLAGTY